MSLHELFNIYTPALQSWSSSSVSRECAAAATPCDAGWCARLSCIRTLNAPWLMCSQCCSSSLDPAQAEKTTCSQAVPQPLHSLHSGVQMRQSPFLLLRSLPISKMYFWYVSVESSIKQLTHFLLLSLKMKPGLAGLSFKILLVIVKIIKERTV